MRTTWALLTATSLLLLPTGSADAGPPMCAERPATHVGSPGNDTIRGTSGPDVIVGLAGNDTLVGLAGNDLICGGPGFDELDGGRGRDRLRGEADGDTLLGGPGNDRLVGGDGPDQVFACLDCRSDIGNDVINMGDGDDAVYDYEGDNVISAGAGDDYVIGSGGSDTIDAGSGRNYVDSGPGDDTITADAPGSPLRGAPANLLIGDLGNDAISGPGVCATGLATEEYAVVDGVNLIAAMDFSGEAGATDLLRGCRDVGNRRVAGSELLDIYPRPFHYLLDT